MNSKMAITILHWAFALAIDTTPGDDIQVYCMYRLIGVSDRTQLTDAIHPIHLLKSDEEEPTHVCKWRGVGCSDSLTILGISWRIHSYRRVDFHWMPGTTMNVIINRIHYSHYTELCTRKLPRALRFCKLVRCGLHGNLDLRTLPMNLQILDLGFNVFTANPTKGHLSVVGWTSTQP
ncbi:hypothetical protein XU18_2985, partial [Perkinsela sp. CCAP 1560/4]